MHNKGNYKQGEKTAFRMGENNSKLSNWQTTNLKNIQAAHAAQFQKNKWPTDISPKKTYRWLTNTWKDAQHHLLSDKCKSKPWWGTISGQSEWLLSKSLQTINAGEGAEKREPSYTCWWECKLVQPLWRTVWRFLKKLEIQLPYDPAIPLLAYTLRKPELKETCVPHCSSQHCL